MSTLRRIARKLMPPVYSPAEVAAMHAQFGDDTL